MKQIILKTEKDTQKFAIKLAKSLKGGEIIALEGDLGAGKTTLTQYLAKAFKVKEKVTSPTFVLMKIYNTSPRLKAPSPKHFIHVDCYRLDDPQELFYLGIEEYLNKKESLVIIEWADKIKSYLKNFKKVVWIKIIIRGNAREFKISA
ncbi:MAG: tRNA (adenosine(37)-N6)-threonylcarbamoyltransferase complex ATPase subunit type 1 TsaE [Candidatus Parcubacteria bacterium]|nr:tRNA (adenosine(37)-N6)-threonylcarbamoyltransferase complex ATPase subunit type 1 TsaE [Candidatus Parcubacteria bacterium]